MKTRSIVPAAGVVLVVIAAVALTSVVWASAQSLQPSTEGQKDKSQIQPPSFTSDMLNKPGAFAPDDNRSAPDAPSAPAQTFSYYQVSGPELQPRTTTNVQVYGANGCVYMSTGTGTGLLTGTGMHIPDGSTIKYIRLYYNDTNASAGVDAFLTRYSPGAATSDLVSAGSTAAFSGGYGFVVSNEITEVVNNASYAYMLYGWPDTNASSLQVCGIRVAYYAPVTFNVALPVVHKQYPTVR